MSQAAPPSPVLSRGHETPLIFTDGGQVFADSGQVLSLTECAAAAQRTGELINPDVLCRWLIWWDCKKVVLRKLAIILVVVARISVTGTPV